MTALRVKDSAAGSYFSMLMYAGTTRGIRSAPVEILESQANEVCPFGEPHKSLEMSIHRVGDGRL